VIRHLIAPTSRVDGPRVGWRDELLTRLAFILFLASTPFLLYLALALRWPPPLLSALALLPISGGLAAGFARRLRLPLRALLLVGALLVSGAISASIAGPSPGTVLSLLLAAVVAAVVFGARGAFLALAAGAGSLLLGAIGRAEVAATWAANLPHFSTWVRMAVSYAVLTGLVSLLVATAVRRAEENALDLRLAEARARASEELFRAIVGDQSEMIVRWKPDGTRTFVNQAYCRVFGGSFEELVGTSFLPNVAEADREGVLRKVRSLTPEKPVLTDTHESITPLGARRHQEWTDRGIFDVDGRLVELQSTGRDVTEQKQAQLALLDSEQRYRLLFDGNPLPMMVYDLDSTRFLAVNAAAVEQYGWSRDELLGMSVADLAVPGDPYLADFVAGLGQPRPSVVHVGLRQQRRRDGSVIDVDMTSLEVPFAGRTARLTLARNVTAERTAMAERERLQAAVERATLEWQRTFDAVEQALVVFDTSLRVVRLNRPAAALVGRREPQELVGRHVGTLGAGEPWATAGRLLVAAAASRAAESADARMGAGGKAWTLTASLSPASTRGEERLILVVAEVTRLVELQDSLRRNETMAAMGSLVAGVAHEVRNPLFGISATLDTLEREYGSQQQYVRFGGVLRSQLERLKQLTEDLLDYGKPPSLRLAEVRAESLVRVAVRSCDSLAQEHGVAVVEDVADGLPALCVDGGRIQQVVENLLANAIQHSPRGSVVRVAVGLAREAETEPACALWLVVEDQGPGVSAEDAAQLFEPFFSRRKGGTGLGLSIVRRIVEAHAGEVTFESLARGARFRVSLPLAGARAALGA
jgi:PAS domain S-box-containing protein